tara:strand:+ start:189 stop:1307 length:1119 start_codon:yes stop_codon:yes gene_type:complete
VTYINIVQRGQPFTWCSLALFFAFLLGFSKPSFGGENNLYITMNVDAFSDSVALADLADWQGDLTPDGTLSYTRQHYQWGRELADSWQIAATYRHSEHYTYDAETAEIYKYFKDSQYQISSAPKNIFLKVSQYTAGGLKLAKWLSIAPRHRLLLTAELLKAHGLVYGQITGQATVSAKHDYQYGLTADYAYSRDYLFSRPSVKSPEGIGFALGFSLKGIINENLTYHIEAQDVAGYIYWSNAPYTIGKVVPQLAYIDEQGYLQTEPAISGYEGYRALYQPLISVFDGNLQYSTNSIDYNFLYHSSYGDQQIGLGMDTYVTQATKLNTSYWPATSKLSIGLEFGPWQLKTGLSNPNLKSSRAVQVALSFNKLM